MVNIVGVFFLCGLALISAAQSKEEDVLQELQGIKKLRSLGLEIAGHLQSLNQDDLNVLDSRLPTQDDLLCLSDLAALVAGLQGGQYWALKSKLTLECRKSYFYDIFVLPQCLMPGAPYPRVCLPATFTTLATLTSV